jgi:hypothetical protein
MTVIKKTIITMQATERVAGVSTRKTRKIRNQVSVEEDRLGLLPESGISLKKNWKRM